MLESDITDERRKTPEPGRTHSEQMTSALNEEQIHLPDEPILHKRGSIGDALQFHLRNLVNNDFDLRAENFNMKVKVI